MKYWDASALVPLLVAQDRSAERHGIYQEDPGIFTWWGTSVECYSALMRLKREDALDEAGLATALERLKILESRWVEVLPQESLRRLAQRMLRVHSLRAADSLHLAAAMTVCEQEPERLEFVSLDVQQSAAARLEGFRVL